MSLHSLLGLCIVFWGFYVFLYSLLFAYIYIYSFVICWFPLNVFGFHFAFLGVTLGFLLEPFGAPWPLKWLLGVTLASLWLPWDSVGPFGAF